jgi:hypothetical protein
MTNINHVKDMSYFKKYGIVIAIVLPVILLVAVRSLGTNHFMSDAGKWYSPSVDQANLIMPEKLNTLNGEKLLISLSEPAPVIAGINVRSINVSADSVISKKYLKIIKGNDGPVILFSFDAALSARIWMVLSQMGVKDILILNTAGNSEVLKYKFRPDTMAEPEL